MRNEDWDLIARARKPLSSFGGGILRFTLLFGSAAIALALLAAPMLDRSGSGGTRQAGWAGLDSMSTGSIAPAGGGGSYTIRRSVLQSSPDAVCIIRPDGRRSGQC